ncbi:MAG: ABC transporter substrate-binding protein [Firmicutes bacterium]|nr:ABC transporter substrate-binding protein [Bacillota bacterium]
MTKLKTTILIALLVTCLTVLCGCTTWDNFKAVFIDKQDQKTTIQIGVLEPVTGADSKAAEDEIRGIQLANKVHPNVNGKLISLVFSDDKSDIDAAETAAKTLVDKKPMVILGSYGNVYSLAASPYIKEAKIPAIAITNTNPLVTEKNPYYYRVCYVTSYQGDLLARYILESEKEKVAGVLIPSDNDVALAEATAFTDRMKAETDDDDSIAYYEEYTTGQKDFTEVLQKLAATKVDKVMLPGDYTDAANIINQAADMGLKVTFLGDDQWENEKFLKMLNSNVSAQNIAFVQFFSPDNRGIKGEAVTKERQSFLKAYAEEYGTDNEPSDSMALGYDAYFVAVDAIDKAPDDATSEDINAILKDPQYRFEGATGLINFNQNGDPIKTAYITTWQNGKMATIHTIEALK